MNADLLASRGNGTRQRERASAARMPAYLEPGASTAVESNVSYRLGKLRERGVLRGSCRPGIVSTASTAGGAGSSTARALRARSARAMQNGKC